MGFCKRCKDWILSAHGYCGAVCEIRDLRAQLAAAVEKACKPHPKCPACHGSGTFQASDEGGMWVACDCAANIYLKLEKAERERAEAKGGEG